MHHQLIRLIVLILLTSCSSLRATDNSSAQSVDESMTQSVQVADSTVRTPVFQSSVQISGQYYALVIGINNYRTLSPLKTAVNDAQAVAQVLKYRYGFVEVIELLNDQATRSGIFEALAILERKLGSQDHLLIYYAGHGEFDQKAERGYWVPADGQLGIKSNWISADDITSALKGNPARKVLVVADSCYSGTLSRERSIYRELVNDSNYQDYLKRELKGQSRILLASGGEEPVTDTGGSGHSIFAQAFLTGLQEADRNVFTAEWLFRNYIIEPVSGGSEQLPRCESIRNSKHEEGDFVFRMAGQIPPPPPLPKVVEPVVKYSELPKEPVVSPPKVVEPVVKPSEPSKECNFCPEMVTIPGGSFMMGSNDGDSNEKPVHSVTVSAFAMGKYEVMRGQFRQFVEATGYKTEAEKGEGCYGWTGSDWEQKPEFIWQNMGFSQSQTDTHPVVCVNWNDAVEYAEWLSQQTGKQYRLPTEAEWEYAARAGGQSKWSFGNDEGQLGNYAWYNENSGSKTHPVGEKQPNAFGLYDMMGNVLEWTCSEYAKPYNGKEQECIGKNRAENGIVLRGGSWYDYADYCGVASRGNPAPSDWNSGSFGFRLVMLLP